MARSARTLDLLNLLALGALADEKLPEEEVVKFSEAARILLPDDEKLELSELQNWLLNNQQQITKRYTGTDRVTAIQQLFRRLSTWQTKEDVVTAIKAISHADRDFHVNEKALISLIEVYWVD